MKPLLLLAASSLALGATACTKAPAPRAALDCPANSGDLTRTSVAPDGKSCTYVTADGAEVTLQLMAVRGDARQTLDALEAQLLAAQPTKVASLSDTAPSPTAAKDAQRAAAEAARDAVATTSSTADASEESVRVDMGDEAIVIAEEGGETRVNLPGVRIVANEDTDSAKVKIGPLSVDANGDDATIQLRRDVRLKGEALAREKRGIRATFVYTGERLPPGYRFVGYEAGGPKTGPLVVAVVKSRNDGDHGGEIYPDVTKLVRRNGGV